MENARVVVIIAALFAVLLSAFGAERLRVCRGEGRCLVESTPGLLPVARLFLTRKSPDRPEPQAAPVEAQAQP